MDKHILDFYKCMFRLDEPYNVLRVKIYNFRDNGVERNTSDERLLNDWLDIRFNKPISVEEYRVDNVNNIFYDESDKTLHINNDVYVIVDDDMFQTFVKMLNGDEESSLRSLMECYVNQFAECSL